MPYSSDGYPEEANAGIESEDLPPIANSARTCMVQRGVNDARIGTTSLCVPGGLRHNAGRSKDIEPDTAHLLLIYAYQSPVLGIGDARSI